MRIAYVCSDPGVPVFGRKGCSVHVQEVIRAWRARGAKIELFAARVGGEPPVDLTDLVVHRLPCPVDDDPRERESSMLAANETIGDAIAGAGRFDFVYERHALWSYAAMEHARNSRIPGILEVNAPLVEEQRRHRRLFAVGAAERAARRAFAAATAIAAVSDSIAEYVRREAKRADHVHVVENGVNPARFTNNVASRREGKRPFTVGFVGSMKAWHGLDTLVDAFALLHQEIPEARLILVGEGPETGALQQQLVRYGYALSNAVHLVGAVDPTEVPMWLRNMDVAVACPPRMDQYYFSPLKVFEYMAAALPVVASRVGQIPRIIDHEVHGLLCEPGNSGEIADALRRIAQSPEFGKRLGRAGRDRVVDRHTWLAIVDRIAALAQATKVNLSNTPATMQEV